MDIWCEQYAVTQSKIVKAMTTEICESQHHLGKNFACCLACYTVHECLQSWLHLLATVLTCILKCFTKSNPSIVLGPIEHAMYTIKLLIGKYPHYTMYTVVFAAPGAQAFNWQSLSDIPVCIKSFKKVCCMCDKIEHTCSPFEQLHYHTCANHTRCLNKHER